MSCSPRLHELLELLVNDSITPEQHEELQNILLDNPEMQDAYLDFVDLHIGLHQLTQADQREREFDILPQGDTETAPVSLSNVSRQRRASPSQIEPYQTDRAQTARFQVTRTVVAISSIATLALLIAFVSSPLLRSWLPGYLAGRQVTTTRPLSEADRTTVTLIQAAGAELFGERLPPLGASLEYQREYALVAGMLKLQFPDGAEVILEAPSVVEFAAADRLIVSMGSCSIYAPPGAEGFQVETPRSRIVDLGTRFSVTVNEVGETDVQVVEGLAEVHGIAEASNEPVLLMEQQSRRFSGDLGDKPQALLFDPQRYRPGLPDRVVSYRATEDEDGSVSELIDVIVQRDGLPYTYIASDLIGVEVIHFCAGKNRSNAVVEVGYQGKIANTLETDLLLQTGMINPGGAVEPLQGDPVLESGVVEDGQSTPGIAIRFRSPVVNGAGPDVIFFELQSVTNPPEGDAFHVSPLRFDRGLHSTTIRRYDITMNSPEAKRLVRFDQYFYDNKLRSLKEFDDSKAHRRVQVLHYRAIAVGIDLTDLGYADGATVGGLFFQDALDDEDMIDPVFIAGLPATERVEP